MSSVSFAGSIADLAWRPDNDSQLAIAVANVGFGVGELNVVDVSTAQPIFHVDLNPIPRAIAWSPDGTKIAIVTASLVPCLGIDCPALRTFDIQSGGELLYVQSLTDIIDVSWRSDGAYIAYSSSNSITNVTDASDGEIVAQYQAENDVPLTVQTWSPSGQWIATVSDLPDGTLRVWNTITGTIAYSLQIGFVSDITWIGGDQYLTLAENNSVIVISTSNWSVETISVTGIVRSITYLPISNNLFVGLVGNLNVGFQFITSVSIQSTVTPTATLTPTATHTPSLALYN